MPRVPPALPLVLAALCLLAAPLAVAAASGGGSTATNAQSPVTVVGLSENTSRIVPLPDTQRANFSTPDASVMATLRMGEADARWTLSRRTLERRLAAADTRAARERILRNATDRVATAISTLLERERELRRDYLAGDLTTEQYVTTLGELHARADRLLTYLGNRGTPASNSLLYHASRGSALRERIVALRAELTPLTSHPGSLAATAVRGGATARIYAAASPNGFVLSTLSDRLHYRAVYRADNVDDVRERRLDLEAARKLMEKYYPTASTGSGTGIRPFDGYAIRLRLYHSHGTISTFIDANTGLPYYETQETALAVVPTEPGWTNTSANYTLAVNESYPGGPLRVQVTHNGTTVDAPVFVAGERVGVTGPDGVLWTLAPYGQFTVTVHVDGETLRVRASTG